MNGRLAFQASRAALPPWRAFTPSAAVTPAFQGRDGHYFTRPVTAYLEGKL
ncbi:MAG TPA: hypothetical protein VFX24_15975 [Ktedonobacterales bacterium]|nr:hypothetical protein [Ktedonobacterales bacterium]